METIKAIETKYNGYLFRSRLEARWAVFFDACGIEYEYESEGFRLEDGTRYLPDFYLPELEYYVEVKGFNDHLNLDLGKALQFAREKRTAIIILSNVPFDNESGGVYWFLAYAWTAKYCRDLLVYRGYFMAYDDGQYWFQDDNYIGTDMRNCQSGILFYPGQHCRWDNKRVYDGIQAVSATDLDTDDGYLRHIYPGNIIQDAMLKARQARFEFGGN